MRPPVKEAMSGDIKGLLKRRRKGGQGIERNVEQIDYFY
jgi:hypothetical protein